MTQALLIIDQQKGIDHPKLGPRNNPSAESKMLELLANFRQKAWPIFHIKHRSSESDSVFWPKQSGFDFKTEFQPQGQEFVIEKTVPCAFVNSSLTQQLQELKIDSLVIVGVATNNSVESSARTAGNLGFSVTVIEDACFTFDKQDFNGLQKSAAEVHAMSLANLHDEYASVMQYQSYFLANNS